MPIPLLQMVMLDLLVIYIQVQLVVQIKTLVVKKLQQKNMLILILQMIVLEPTQVLQMTVFVQHIPIEIRLQI